MQIDEEKQWCKQSPPTESTPRLSSRTIKRKSSGWKLKFHHQALPPKYLDHYKATLQQNPKVKCDTTATHFICSTLSTLLPPSSYPTMTMACISAMVGSKTTAATSLAIKNNSTVLSHSTVVAATTPVGMGSTIHYKDLPFMGEMKLENARPRRGRKPKKADICHLIYKNYGTTVVAEPLNLCLRDLQLGSTTREASSGSTIGPVIGGIEDDGGGTSGINIRENIVSIHKFGFTGDAVSMLQQDQSANTGTSFDSLTRTKTVATVASTLRLLEKKNRLQSGHRMKQKSRKSLAREKLEKTFEESGFLIQTQQLESAQGATYCKFKRLRKFTRYLFKSWKHHLPGNVIDNGEM